MTAINAWYRDESYENPTELHQTDPPQWVTIEELQRETGVNFWRVGNCHDPEVQKKLSEGYLSSDIMDMCREVLGDEYEKKVASYCAEHLHEDAEIRLVLAGQAYFDVRTYDDRWIRVYMDVGDLIHLPAGVYHRLTLDAGKYIKFYRLFSELPGWKAYFRPDGDSLPIRAQYLATRQTTVPVA